MPHPPIKTRPISKGENKGALAVDELILDPKYLAHPLYVLTRVRHFPNEGKRDPGLAAQQGIRAGAFDIF